ncbi:ATP-dependent Clp protease adapter ClpS [Haloferula chungangensis]|uniref:ATP-dependent Clp protease adapter protein ClpS n=1 Tax=Haloferula chungangensis TaxID=1048331 RepID=A0ABW2L4S5_9BACT
MSDTQSATLEATSLDVPWNVVVHDDPVNLMDYVTWVFVKVFGYSQIRATKLMMEVHQAGRSIVWTGAKERAELYTQQLQGYQLKTSMERSSE